MSGLMEEVRHRLTTADYHKMGAAGVFGPTERVELIEGEIIDMAPIGSPHAGIVGMLNNLLVPAVAGKAIVHVQNPIVLGDLSEPQPDIAVLEPRADYYRHSHPTAVDLILLIEVAESSLDFDRQIKLPLYARYGVPEVWLVDLQHRVLVLHRRPHDGAYQESVVQQDLTRVAPRALPDAALDLSDLFRY
ncbi:MAG: Uma2 family endonuclease [Nitrococcus sp.]|nr:Uma2 family endonuclease [Nitrococcus sp.]